MKHSIRIAIAEDHNVVRQALTEMLKREPKIQVVFDVPDGAVFLENLTHHSIDIALLDLDMPKMDGKDTMRHLKKSFPDVKVIILSMHDDPWIIKELMVEGAKGFLRKNCSFDEMVDMLFAVHSDVLLTTPKKLETFLDMNARELLVLKMICDGKKSEEIAERMSLSKKTIDAIRSELLKRLDAKNPAEFVRKSILLGLYMPRTDEQIAEEDRVLGLLKQLRVDRRKKKEDKKND